MPNKSKEKSPFTNLSSYDTFLLKYSKTIDDIDVVMSAFGDLSQLSGSEPVRDLGNCIYLAQYTLKVPFAALYLARTRDFSALLNWVPMEIISAAVPFGGFLEIMRNYEGTTKRYFEKEMKKEKFGLQK